MPKLITVQKAKEEIKRLQTFISLVDSYEADSAEKVIIKEYAISNSISKVVNVLKEQNITLNGKSIEKNDVVMVITSKATDELHRLVKSGYMKKTKHLRKNQ